MIKKGNLGALVMFVFLILAVSPLIPALDTKINIHANPGKTITVKILDEVSGKTLEGYSYKDVIIDDTGIFTVTFTSDIQNKIKISTIMRPQMKIYQIFHDIKTGWEYDVFMNDGTPSLSQIGNFSGKTEDLELSNSNESGNVTGEIDENLLNTEDTLVEKEEVDNKEVDNKEVINNPVTGAVVGSALKIKSVLFFGIGFVFIAVFFILFVLVKKAKQGKKTYVHFKLKDEAQEHELEDAEKKIEEAEKEMKEARREIKEIMQSKSKEKEIEDAQTKIKEYQEKINKLKENKDLGSDKKGGLY